MTLHTVAECPQNPVLESINKTIDRWDKRMDRQDELMERQAIAMEAIAYQGATIAGHGQRLDEHATKSIKLETDIDQAFVQLRDIELRHAKEDGRYVAEKRQQRFWDSIKKQFTDRALVGLLFLWWLSDKFHVPTTIGKWLKEFKG
jgi:hypothetical protein